MALDYGHQKADDDLKALEKKIVAGYTPVKQEISDKITKYLESFKKQDDEKIRQLKNNEITEKEYLDWRAKEVMGTSRWEQLDKVLAKDISNANQIATKMTSGTVADVYALNANFGIYEIEKDTGANISFTLYDKKTVERMIKEDDFPIVPRMDIPKDQRWNAQKINSAMLQGILSGDSIPDIAKRLRGVTDMNISASIRNARTYVTGAENRGRIDSYKYAESLGIQRDQIWLATIDDRTRASHIALDKERVDIGEKFSNGCEYPGDPNGAPEEIYNCRCTLVSCKKGKPFNDVRNVSEEDYEEWKHSKEKEAQKEGETKDEFLAETEPMVSDERVSEDFKSEFVNFALDKSHNEKIEFIGDYDPRLAFDLNTSFDENIDEKIDDAILKHIEDTYTIEINGETYRNVDSSAIEFMNNQMNGSEEDKELVNNGYCKNFDSFIINDALRNNYVEKLSEEQKSVMDAMDRVIEQNKLKEDCHFIRYADQNYLSNMLNLGKDDVQSLLDPKNADLLDGLKSLKGTILSEKAYLSTSSDEKANIFNDKEVKLSIIAEKGTPAYFTNNKNESEVILGRNSKYVVEDVVVLGEKFGKNQLEFLVRIINE